MVKKIIILTNKDGFVLHRVSYGSSQTPVKSREYVGDFWGSPVGTKAEWQKWAKENDKKIQFKESPKKRIFVNE